MDDVLSEHPSREHRRRMMFRLAVKGEDELLRVIVQTGASAHPHPDQAKQLAQGVEEDPENPDPDVEVDMSCTPIQAAAHNGNFACVKVLIEEGGVDVDAKDESGVTALIRAAGARSVEMVEYLLSKGANPAAAQDPDNKIAQEYSGEWAGADALVFAAGRANMDIVRLLLDGDEQDESRIPRIAPMHIKAVSGGHGPESLNILKLFLSRASYPVEPTSSTSKANLLTPEQHNAIQVAVKVAAEDGTLECLRFLLGYIYPTDAKGELGAFELPAWLHDSFVHGAYQACLQGQDDKFRWLTSFNIAEPPTRSLDNLRGQRLNYSRMMETAAEHGHVNIIKMLMEEYGTDPVRLRIPPGMTPLWCAAVANQLEATRYLLSFENVRDVGIHLGHGRWMLGPTPLFTAISVRSEECALKLLKHGGPINEIDEEIRIVKEPMTAVLTCSMTRAAPVRLLTEDNAKKYEDDNVTRLIRLEIDQDDKEWVSKLISRKSEEDLSRLEPSANARSLWKDALKEEEVEASWWDKFSTEWPTLKYRENALEWDNNSVYIRPGLRISASP